MTSTDEAEKEAEQQNEQKELEEKVENKTALSVKEIGIMGIGPLELCHLVLFIIPFIWTWILGWLGFGIFWSILTAITVFAFRLSKLKYSSDHKMLQLLMDAVSLENLHERNHKKRYELVEKFVEAKFPAMKTPWYQRQLDYEKMEWFNSILNQLWPYIGDYVRRLMKEQIEPQIAAAVPQLKIKFEQFDLGKRQPRVERIKVYHLKECDDRSYIDIDLQLNWVSDMEVELSVMGAPITLKQIEFKGELRVTLEPLITDVPIVGSVAITFLEPPCIDFNMDGVAAVANAPGVYQGIKMGIGSVLNSMLVLPKRIDIPLTDELTNEIRCRLPAGICRVIVVQAENLRDADYLDKSDPYCIVKIGCEERKTKTIDNTLNPVWADRKFDSDRYVFDYPIHDEHTQIIHVNVFDEDDTSVDDTLGCFQVPVKEIIDANEDYIDRWFPLVGEGAKQKGVSKVRLIVHWLELRTVSQSTVSKIENARNELDLDHFYIGLHLDKVLEMPDGAQGKQIEAELKMTEHYKGNAIKHDKQKTMKVIGPDCSFASSFYYTTKTAENLDLKFEFVADTLYGEEIFDTFSIMKKNMLATILDDKNVLHIDENCAKKSRIKAKLVLRRLEGHKTAWNFPDYIKPTKSLFAGRPKVADAIPESISDTGRTMDNVISTLSGEGLRQLFGRGSIANFAHTDEVKSIVKLEVVAVLNREVKIKIVSGGGAAGKPMVNGSKLKFYLGDKSESSKVYHQKGFTGQEIRLSRSSDEDIKVFMRKDKKNLAMGYLKQVPDKSAQEVTLYECITKNEAKT